MKKNAWNRALASILTMAMLVSMWVVPASAKTFSDTKGHWATEYIDKWSEYNLLEGIGNNLFEPDRAMTVGEVSKVISVLMGYSEKAENKFTDVPKGVWYEDFILKMASAKLLPSSGSINPEKPITRGEVFTILAKAFELAPKSGATIFADDASISAEQRPYIKALQEEGALNGKPVGGTIIAAANDSLTRSELMKMFDRMAGDLLNTAGEYQKDYSGNLVINATGVKLSNSTINGNLFIAEGVGNGDVFLTGVTVKGTIFVKGGGANSFHASNVRANKIVLDHSGLSAKFSGNSFANNLEVRQNTSISYDGARNYKLTDRFIITSNNGTGQTITLSNVNAGALENNVNGTTLKGTAKFDKKEGSGSFSKDSSVVIGTPSTGGGSTGPVEKTITIFSFNDFHGSLDKSVSTSNPGADRFVGYINDQVAKAPNSTLVLVAGDNYQGSALSNMNLGKPVSDMLKSMGLKYSALGNHEFDWDTDLINTWATDGGVTFLAANIIETATGKSPDFCEPYRVEVVDGVRIGIIGFITQDTPTLVKASNVAGLEFKDPAPIATALAAKLRTEENCDVVIALTHMGANQATPNSSAVITGEAARLADNVAAGTLDAIISGHSHTKVAGVVNGTPIVQGAYNGRGVGKLEFTLTNRVLTSVTPTYEDVDKDYATIDPDVKAMVDSYNVKLAPVMAEFVGVGGPFAEKEDLTFWAGELIFNYVKRETGHDYVVIQNDGGWRKGTWGEDSPKGNRVTMGYLFTLMPFDNEIVLIDEMLGADLLEILNQKKADGTPTGFTSKPDINGASKSGDDWYLADGTKILPDGKYKVMCNDFMLTGGDKYSQFIPYSTNPSAYRFIGIPLRTAMAEQLKFEFDLNGNAVTVYSFNDFHGSLDKSVSTSNPGADRFVGYINDQVAKAPDNTLVLVAGDNYQGSALSNMNLGKPVSDMLKSMGLKYSALGNHEFDWNTDLINTWADDGGVTFLAANIIETATEKTPDFCEPYRVEVVDGVRIGIIGFITQDTPTLVKASNVAGLEFRDPAPIATELAAKLRTEENCDVVIALTHMGANQATPNSSAVITGEAARLANNVAAGTLDAIISGHSHTKVAGVANGIPIVQGAYNGRGVGKLEFILMDGAISSVTPTYEDVDKNYATVDEGIKTMVEGYNAALAPVMAEVVGVGGPFADKGEMTYWAGELIFNYIKREVGAEYIVIQNDGGWRSGTWGTDSPKDNKVTMGYLFTLMPFDNEIVLIDKMKGADLLEILNQKKADGTSTGFTSKPDINGASKIGEDWYLADGTTKIVADGEYKVMCNDFMLTGGDKYSQFIPYSTNPSAYRFIGTPLRTAMAEQLKFEKPLLEGDVKDLSVFFVSDLHGAFSGTNYATQKLHGGLSRVATLLKQERATRANSLTIDIGDTIQGAGSTGFIGNLDYAYPLLKGFEYLNFDAVVLGNHEFNFGIDNMLLAYNGEYEGVNGTITGVKEFTGAKLAGNVFRGSFTGDANVTGTDPLLPEFKAYEIFELDGVKVAIIGMTNPGSDVWDAVKMNQAGYYTESAIGATKRAIAEIKDGKLADVIVLAAHMSTGDSFERPGSGANSVLADEYIAANVDVFLGGHGHRRQTMTLNGVKYGENQNAGASLGIVDIKVTYEDGKWVVKEKAGDGVTITMKAIATTAAEDADYLAHMQPEHNFAVAYTNAKIGELINGDMINASPLGENMNRAYTEPTKLVEFIHDVQLYYSEAQISIACPFSMDVQHKEGGITRGTLIGIYNYDSNTVYRLSMKGWQVDRYLEYIAKSFYTAPNVGTDLSIQHASTYLTDSLGGVKYTIDLTAAEGSRATITHVRNADGEWEAFDEDATYLVAANDYRTSSGILSAGKAFTAAELAADNAPKLLEVDCNRGLEIAPDILSLMVHYITVVKGGVIDAGDYESNWKITPWWDPDLRDEAEELITDGHIDATKIKPNSPLTKQMVIDGHAKAAAENPVGFQFIDRTNAVAFGFKPAA